MEITAAMVKELREKSGAGVMDAKKALQETNGDMDKAIELLHEKGIAKAAKKADRVAAEGLTAAFVDGNTAALIEVNSETDFVAKNQQFVDLVNEAAEIIAKGKPTDDAAALALKTASGATLEEAFTQATATIGEKISFRRFKLLDKTDAQVFGLYLHNGGRIGAITVLEGGDEAMAKAISMQVASMSPTVLSHEDLDEDFIHEELAQMNHKIDQDNEARAMVDKPALPHLKFGSMKQITQDILAKAEADIKAELKAEGKPEQIWDKILPGKMERFIQDNTKVDMEYALLSQLYIMDEAKTVAKFLEEKGAKAIAFVRFEVGEGIEKKEDDFAAEVAAQMAAASGK